MDVFGWGTDIISLATAGALGTTIVIVYGSLVYMIFKSCEREHIIDVRDYSIDGYASNSNSNSNSDSNSNSNTYSDSRSETPIGKRNYDRYTFE